MTSSVWDDPDLALPAGDYVKFVDEGDSVVGNITGIMKGTTPNGDPCPQLNLETEEGERTVTASQMQLHRKLKELRPEPGDRIAIVLTQVEPRPGGKTLKHFDVQLQRGGGEASAPPAQPAAAPPAQPAPQQPAPAQSNAAAALL